MERLTDLRIIKVGSVANDVGVMAIYVGQFTMKISPTGDVFRQ